MIGVWVNALTVVAGGVIGTLLRGGITEKFRLIIHHALALCVLVIGISGAIAADSMMGVIVSVVAGSAIGEWLRIEDGLDKLGAWAQRRFARGDDGFSQGFVSATLLFCVGAMAVVGSLEAGLSGKADTLLAKSALDGVSAAIFASTLGPGVILSAVPLTLYQGGIALLAGQISGFLSENVIAQMSAVGSLLIIGLGMNMFGLTKERIRVGNMLPAMVVILAYQPAAEWLARLFA